MKAEDKKGQRNHWLSREEVSCLLGKIYKFPKTEHSSTEDKKQEHRQKQQQCSQKCQPTAADSSSLNESRLLLKVSRCSHTTIQASLFVGRVPDYITTILLSTD